jgi:beta-N-acetylhexosaminidase
MRILLRLLLIVALLAPALRLPMARAQPDPARQLLDAMTPAEKVGQLFVVTFTGQEVGPNSEVAALVRDERVGGVALLAANQNFVNDENAPFQVRDTSQQLQALALESGSLPLFVAIDHEGDGWPYSRLTGGTTPLPNPMAVGATWNPDLAREMGHITGQELAAAGINLLLGPDADVLSEPRAASRGDLGTRVFGGDPYWVGRMGRAYVAGVHEGSAGRMATVAKHFPGHGGSDRLPDDEVATVDKSLQELRRIELAPFFAVTRYEVPDDPAATDALMSSHIRYRGFQGNIRQFTAPISFDPQGLRTILAEEEFAQWRERGLMVSDSLGVPAVKKYFDPTGQTFPHRQIARDALMAGNDLLILAQFAREDAWAPQLANMRDAMAYFREQYGTDRAFTERVDEAVLKIIRLKLKLYPEFAEGAAALPALPEPTFGQRGAFTQAVAEEALTLLFPRTREELDERLPRAPLRGEPIVIFTDARRVRDCFDCPYYQLLPTDALQRAILRRYGPEGTDQVTEAQIISFSFEDLKLFLGAPGVLENSADPAAAAERAEAVRNLVERAEWILLVMQDINLSPAPGSQSQAPRYPESDAARLLLDAAAGSLFNKRVVAFAFNVPYQLDTTEITKLSAAFALYSRQEPFVDVAARALFRELAPHTSPPVTVDAVNYDLPMQLEPDPRQLITLEGITDTLVSAPADLEVSTSVILDRNGHPVPDGTSVEIGGTWLDAPGTAGPRVAATTTDGIARATLPLTMDGILELRVVAGQAESERPLVVQVGMPTPTPTPTLTPSAEPSVTPEPTATRTATNTPEPVALVSDAVDGPPFGSSPDMPEAPTPPAPEDPLSLFDFLLGAVGTLLAVGSAWRLSRGRPLTGRVRAALLVVIGGMGSYLLWGATGAAGGLLLAAPVSLLGALLALGITRLLPQEGATGRESA